MNVDPRDDLDRAIDQTLASMLGGEPRRVTGASVRQAMGESSGVRRPLWLAAAAALIAALGVSLLKDRAPVAPASAARSTESPAPAEVRVPSPSGSIPAARVAPAGLPRPAREGSGFQVTAEGPYEGLPRLTIASIALPEPLSGSPLDSDPIRIPRIEIAPLSISGLSNEPEPK